MLWCVILFMGIIIDFVKFLISITINNNCSSFNNYNIIIIINNNNNNNNT